MKTEHLIGVQPVHQEIKVIVGELLRYGIVGTCCTCLDVIVLNILKNYLHFPLWLALAVGFVSGTILGFFLHGSWTFSSDIHDQRSRKLLQFIALSVSSLILTEIIVHAYLLFWNREMVLINWRISAYNLGKLFSIVVIYIWNFSVSRFIIFRKANVNC